MPWTPLGEDPRPPVRKDVGTIGRKIRLTANFFNVDVKNPNLDLVHYNVTMEDVRKGEVPMPKKKKLKIFENMKGQYPKVFKDKALGYDSEKNAFSVGMIPQLKKKGGTKYEVDVSDERGGKSKFRVHMTVVNMATLKDLVDALKANPMENRVIPVTIFQMLEVIMNHYSSYYYERVGRHSFFPMGGEFGPAFDIGGGKEGVVGFFDSLRPAQWKNGSFLLNVDVAHAVFYQEQSVLDFVKKVTSLSDRDLNQPLPEFKKKDLEKELKQLKITATHTNIPRTYKVSSIGNFGADRQQFPLEDPRTKKTTRCTVQDYFRKQYDKHCQYPKLNCLKVGPEHKNIYLPMEYCKIAKGQKVRKRLGEQETAMLIRSTAKAPVERLNQIKNIVRTHKFNNDPMMKALQFSISDMPMTLDGRVIPAPMVLMNQELAPRFGVWDTRDRTFFNSASIKSWAVVNYNCHYIKREMLLKFVNSLRRMGGERGMTIPPPAHIMDVHAPNPERDLLEIKNKIPDVELILVVLPRHGKIYSRIKVTGDRTVGVITQCIQAQNVSKNAPAVVGNLLLKINHKMGGISTVLGEGSRPPVFKTPVMIMGADVNHPPADDRSTPSLAAVVASFDRFASKYATEIRHQSHRTEMIQEMKDMTKNLLKGFFRATKRKPERIIMYRDGVSESQFLEVLSFELRAMRAACTELQKDYEPAITFLVVQKRHHTRLFCHDRDGVGRAKNIPPGTTVDTVLTHPSERDFYLCSHQGIQGTSRPTHYHVLWDDSDMTMDQLETLTYAMCHLYSRCTRSVSIPTPAYYAHLAAFRAKVHTHELCGSDTASSMSDEPPSDAQMTEAVKMSLGKELFYKAYYV